MSPLHFCLITRTALLMVWPMFIINYQNHAFYVRVAFPGALRQLPCFLLATTALRQGTIFHMASNQAEAEVRVWSLGRYDWVYKRKQNHVTCAGGTLIAIEMGKSKTTKFKRPQFNAVGLQVNAVKEADAEDEDHGDDCCPAAELLEKVRRQFKLVFSIKCCFVAFHNCTVDSDCSIKQGEYPLLL